MARIDEISKYYNIPDKLEKAANFLFYIVAALAIYLPLINDEETKDIIAPCFISFVVLYFLTRYSNSLFFQPNAENMRRKQFLSDAFGIPLTHETTKEYYNNSFPPSVARLGANLLENSLFSRRILEKMLVRERVKIALYLILWVAALASGKICQDVIIIISQSVFSAEILARWINLEMLKVRYTEAYKDLYNFFLTKQHLTTDPTPFIIDDVLNYECAKSAAGIKLSTSFFGSINPTVTAEWEVIKKTIRIP